MNNQLTLAFFMIFFTSITYAQTQEINPRVDEDFPLLISTPKFKDGGDEGLAKFLANNLDYPNGQRVNAVVYVEFIVDVFGNVKNEKVINGITKEIDTEALRVVRLLKFIPVEQMGSPVAVRHHLFIDFSLIEQKQKNYKRIYEEKKYY